jgi:hypothetical protein
VRPVIVVQNHDHDCVRDVRREIPFNPLEAEADKLPLALETIGEHGIDAARELVRQVDQSRDGDNLWHSLKGGAH